MVRLYLRPGLGGHRLDRLSLPTVQTFFNSGLSAGDSIAKVHVMRVVLSAALTRAMREELVSRNVARLVTLPPAPPVTGARGQLMRHAGFCELPDATRCMPRSPFCLPMGCDAARFLASAGMMLISVRA